MNTARGVVDMLIEAGAFLKDGHFVLASWRHAAEYVDKNKLFVDTHRISRLCHLFASRFVEQGVEVVIGPASGGIVLSQWTAYHLTELTGRSVKSVYADKIYIPGSLAWYLFGLGRPPREELVIKRGYRDIIRNRRALIVEDVGTTGTTLRRTVQAAAACDADIVGAALLCSRGGLMADDVDAPDLYSLIPLSMETWSEEECPLCRDKVPVNTEYGHGAEYMARKERERFSKWIRRVFGARC